MKKTYVLLLLLAICNAAFCQDDWGLRRDENGIKIYTRNTPNSNYKSIKVECSVAANVSQVLALLFDIKNQKNWIYSTRESHILKQVRPNEFLFYAEVSLPWPCTNRDYIAHFVVSQVSPTLTVIDSKAVPEELPEIPGKIRVKNSVSHWEIATITANLVQITYTVQIDPAGSLPAWITNLFLTKGPYQTFSRMREEVVKPEYNHPNMAILKS